MKIKNSYTTQAKGLCSSMFDRQNLILYREVIHKIMVY